MTRTSAEGATDDAAGGGRRGLRRLFARPDDPDRSTRRAGADPFPVVLVTPRRWIALG